MLSRYLIPVAPFALIGLTSILCLLIFLRLDSQIRALKSRGMRSRAIQEAHSRDLQLRLDKLSERLRETEERTGVLIPPAPPKSGLNLNKRSQALRMLRRGEPAGSVAASLHLPHREVELLLKVQGMVLNGSRES